MEIYHPYIINESKILLGDKNKFNHFHILGIDIILDEKNKPWLLEMNYNPSLLITHEDTIVTKDMKTKMHISKTDMAIKEPVVYDAI